MFWWAFLVTDEQKKPPPSSLIAWPARGKKNHNRSHPKYIPPSSCFWVLPFGLWLSGSVAVIFWACSEELFQWCTLTHFGELIRSITGGAPSCFGALMCSLAFVQQLICWRISKRLLLYKAGLKCSHLNVHRSSDEELKIPVKNKGAMFGKRAGSWVCQQMQPQQKRWWWTKRDPGNTDDEEQD